MKYEQEDVVINDEREAGPEAPLTLPGRLPWALHNIEDFNWLEGGRKEIMNSRCRLIN